MENAWIREWPESSPRPKATAISRKGAKKREDRKEKPKKKH
jgi:hypothetical protein